MHVLVQLEFMHHVLITHVHLDFSVCECDCLRVLMSVTRSRLSQPLWIAARYVVMVKGKKECGNHPAIPTL